MILILILSVLALVLFVANLWHRRRWYVAVKRRLEY